MGRNTSIEWTDHSWPVINGCRRKSEGCRNCYAERLIATRLRHTPKYKGLAVYTEGGPRWTGESRLWAQHLDMPLKIKKPARIFVADMGDLFFEGNSNEDIAAVFGVMAACPHHTFQVLTKRPERAVEWFRWLGEQLVSLGGPKVNAARGALWYAWHHIDSLRVFDAERPWIWPLPNVHFGVSVENQPTVDERVPLLRQIPAAVHFISAEPLLERIDLRTIPANYDGATGDMLDALSGCEWFDQDTPYGLSRPLTPAAEGPRIDFVIVGGESGPGARPFDSSWATDIIQQCGNAGSSVFVKQLGSNHFAPWLLEWVERPSQTSGYALEAEFEGVGMATVWRNGVWHTWDANGTGGENSQEPTVALAQRAAIAALQRQHITPFKGWARHAHMLRDRKGADMAEWPLCLRVREFPRNDSESPRVEEQHS